MPASRRRVAIRVLKIRSGAMPRAAAASSPYASARGSCVVRVQRVRDLQRGQQRRRRGSGGHGGDGYRRNAGRSERVHGRCDGNPGTRTLVRRPHRDPADLRRRDTLRVRREERRGGRDGRSPACAVRARRPALPRPALRRGDADDPQSERRRGSRPGDLREGVRRVPPVHRGHQPQGLAVPHPDEHVHQQLPQEAAPAARVRQRGRRGLAARPRRVAHLERAALRRDGSARPPARLGRQGRAAGAARGLPPRGLPRRRRGLRVQGDRRDHGYADRHRDVAPAPRPQAAAEPVGRLRP